MGTISIEGLEVKACHGVNAEEKVNAQRFVFDVAIDADIHRAAASDSIDDTISYSAVKKFVVAFATQNSFDLIETLADRTAVEILSRFRGAKAVSVKVSKPDAPMSGKFDCVAVTSRRRVTRAYLSLGSNMGDRDGYLDLAVARLKQDMRFSNVVESRRIRTAPYGGVAQGEFVNSAVSADTCCDPEELLEFVAEIEAAGGRVRREHWGDRTLDVDILFFGDEVICTDELVIPHPDMQRRAFVLEPLSMLAPNFVHPVLKKSVAQLLDELGASERT